MTEKTKTVLMPLGRKAGLQIAPAEAIELLAMEMIEKQLGLDEVDPEKLAMELEKYASGLLILASQLQKKNDPARGGLVKTAQFFKLVVPSEWRKIK